LTDVVVNGIVIPTVNQTESGFFEYYFKFPQKENKKYYYKIYYQNESYKFDARDSLNHENFYGSWEDTSIGFLPVENEETSGKIRIVGNPRNEEKYLGADISENNFSFETIDGYIKTMHSNADWYASIVKKAENNQVTIEEQLYRDALWLINDARSKGEVNNRWKRNPRVGVYSFLLVICDEKNLNKIPDYIQNIELKNKSEQYVNPIYWFQSNKNSDVILVNS
jgi:hypothetical protein